MKYNSLLNDIAYISFILNLISIYCFSAKVATVDLANIIFGVNTIVMLTFVVCRNNRVKLVKIHLYFFVLFLWANISLLWSIDIESAISKVITLSLLFIYSCIMYEYFKYQDNAIRKILIAIYYAGLVMSLYALWIYTPSGIIDAFTTQTRLGTEINNANVFGINAALSAVIGFTFYLYYSKRIYLFGSILCLIMALVSGSVKVLVILFIGYLYIVGKVYEKKKIWSSVLFLSFSFLIIDFLIGDTGSIFTLQRMEEIINVFTGEGATNHSTLLRLFYIKVGFEAFLNNPILGYGLEGFATILLHNIGEVTYSHNNYIEMLVNLGLVGFIIYYSIYSKLFKKLFKYTGKDIFTKLIFIILVSKLFSDIASVSYYSKETYILLVLYYICSTNTVVILNNELNGSSDGEIKC